MARPKSPEGKRVTICVKVSELDAAAIDVARGELTRSAWMRGLALAAVHGDRPVQARPVRQRRQAEAKPRSARPVAETPPKRSNGPEGASDIAAFFRKRRDT